MKNFEDIFKLFDNEKIVYDHLKKKKFINNSKKFKK